MRFAISAVAAMSGLSLLGLAFFGQPAVYLRQAVQEWDSLMDRPQSDTKSTDPVAAEQLADADTESVQERTQRLQQEVARLRRELAARRALEAELGAATVRATPPLATATATPEPAAPPPTAPAVAAGLPPAPTAAEQRPVAISPVTPPAPEPSSNVLAEIKPSTTVRVETPAPAPVTAPPMQSATEPPPVRLPFPPAVVPPVVAEAAPDLPTAPPLSAPPKLTMQDAQRITLPPPPPVPRVAPPILEILPPAAPPVPPSSAARSEERRPQQPPSRLAATAAPNLASPERREPQAATGPAKPEAQSAELTKIEPPKPLPPRQPAVKPAPPPLPQPGSPQPTVLQPNTAQMAALQPAPSGPNETETQSVLSRLRQGAPNAPPQQPDPLSTLERRPKTASAASLPRLNAARSALANGRLEDARRLLQEAQLQLVFRPIEALGEEPPSASRGAGDVAHALEALSANDSQLSRRYIDVAIDDISGAATSPPIQESNRRPTGYAPAYPPR